MRIHATLIRGAVLALGLGVAGLSAERARADVIELTNGNVLQGDVDPGRTADEGLALNLYETGGVVIIKWEHILPARAKALRLEFGVDFPEETEVSVEGHRVRLTTGEVVVGVSDNPRGSEPLRIKTRTGVKTYDRSVLAGPVEDTKVDGNLVYTEEELYQHELDKDRPETAAAHKAFGQKCLTIGAYEHAKEHFQAAKADAAYMDTVEGRTIDGLLARTDLMIRSKAAGDLARQVKLFSAQGRHNEAKKALEQFDEQYKDPQVRESVGFDLLQTRTLKARDDYFKRQIALSVFSTMDRLIDAKAREQKPLHEDPNAAKGTAAAGTLAAARQWEMRDLYNQLWEKVGTDLGLTKEEMETYWKNRSVKQVRRAGYGTGSFIVVKKDTPAPKPGAPAEPPRRRPPSDTGKSGGKNVPTLPAKVDKPPTEEEWWADHAGPSERAKWLTAWFVESSGMFDVQSTPQVSCTSCGGTGSVKSTGSDGSSDEHFCPICFGAKVVRTVNYR